jgi:hypothetical protein
VGYRVLGDEGGTLRKVVDAVELGLGICLLPTVDRLSNITINNLGPGVTAGYHPRARGKWNLNQPRFEFAQQLYFSFMSLILQRQTP